MEDCLYAFNDELSCTCGFYAAGDRCIRCDGGFIPSRHTRSATVLLKGPLECRQFNRTTGTIFSAIRSVSRRFATESVSKLSA